MTEPPGEAAPRGRWPGVVALGLLAVAAAAVAVTSEGEAGSSPLPSTRNPGPRGLAALYEYLEGSGAPVARLEAPFTELGPDDAVVVVTGPLQARPGDEELASLLRWLDRGGTLVLLLGADDPHGKPLAKALGVDRGSAHRGFQEARQELTRSLEALTGGADARGVRIWPWTPVPSLAAARDVRVAHSAQVLLAAGVPLAGDRTRAFLYSAIRERGRVVVLARPDPFENHWVGRADDLAFDLGVLALAARPGRIRFDEHHLARRRLEVSAPGVLAAFAQLCLAAVLLGLARGVRLGAARPTVSAPGRSRLEYVARLGELYRRAGAEDGLLGQLHASFRRRLNERLGISVALDEPAVDEALAARGVIEPGAWLSLARELAAERAAGAGPEGWARLSRRFAELEERFSTGGRPAP